MDERPSWPYDTLSGDEPDPCLTEFAMVHAALDQLDAAIDRWEHESDKPPPDEPPPDAAGALVPEAA